MVAEPGEFGQVGFHGVAGRSSPSFPRGGSRSLRWADFTGHPSAAAEALEHVTTVMDPLHVMALIGERLDCALNASCKKPSATGTEPGTCLPGLPHSLDPGQAADHDTTTPSRRSMFSLRTHPYRVRRHLESLPDRSWYLPDRRGKTMATLICHPENRRPRPTA